MIQALVTTGTDDGVSGESKIDNALMYLVYSIQGIDHILALILDVVLCLFLQLFIETANVDREQFHFFPYGHTEHGWFRCFVEVILTPRGYRSYGYRSYVNLFAIEQPRSLSTSDTGDLWHRCTIRVTARNGIVNPVVVAPPFHSGSPGNAASGLEHFVKVTQTFH
jgi:hypothetical protein